MYLLLGMGISNASIAKYLYKNNIEFVIYDDRLNKDYFEYKYFENLNDISIIVKSSGIDNDHFLIVEGIKRHIEVITDLELYYRLRKHKNKIATVTGTNGKSTTVTLVFHLINDVNIAGNIGKPLFDYIDDDKDIIIEASSYMGEYIKEFSSTISCILNIYPNHLKHHKTFNNYILSKEKIIKNTSDVVIYNLNDKLCCDMINNITTVKHKFTYSTNNLKADLYVLNDKIYYESRFILNVNTLPLYLNKYIENVLCAILIALSFNVDIKDIRERIKTYKSLEHRLEEVGTINNMVVINDSKSTNFYALSRAVNALKGNRILLILGGKIKDDDYNLIPYNLISKALVNGENKDILYNNFMNRKIEVIKYDTLNDLLTSLIKDIEESKLNDFDFLLFSPGSESFDQFENFEERGKFFKKTIELILKK